MRWPATQSASDVLLPRAVMVLSQRPRPGLGRILPTLEAVGVPAVLALSGQIGDTLPRPFHGAPEQVVILATDAESVRVGLHAGAGLVAGLGSGSHATAQLAAGAELVLQAPSQIAGGDLLRAYASKFSSLPSLGPDLAGLVGADLALFFDYDGTLAPVPEHPTEGQLPEPMRDTLARLSARYPLAVVSGRTVADLSRRLQLPGLYLAGNHGLDLHGPDYAPERHMLAVDWRPILDAAHAVLAPLAQEHPGCVVEHKCLTLTVHYRGLAMAARVALRRAVVSRLAAFDRLLLESGQQVLEVHPTFDWHKGSAVDWLLARMQSLFGPCKPIYFGDDLADEPAFRAARRAGGYGVVIGTDARPTSARFRLAAPGGLPAALASLLA